MHTVCSHICKQNTHKFKSDKMICIMNIDIFSVNLCALKCIKPILLSLVYVEFFFFILLPYDMYLPHILSRPKIHSPPPVIQRSFIYIQKRTELTNFKQLSWNKVEEN